MSTSEQGTGSMVVKTAEDIIEDVTNTQTPTASAEVLIGWIIKSIEQALGGANPTAAVQAHLADLQNNKESLAQAVAANS